MDDYENIWLQKKLAFEAVRHSAAISMGVALVATGFGLLVAVMTILFQDSKLAVNLISCGVFLIIVGGILISIQISNAKKKIFNLKFPNYFKKSRRDKFISFWHCKTYNGIARET